MAQLTLVPSEVEEYAQAHTTAPAPLFEELKDLTYAQMSSPGMH
ncbi:hypothetical protein [Pyxidicoccus trucidator]|nr:hypothetical protein [Pyxidicoccus trucidator]